MLSIKGFDYGETFSHVALLEVFRIFLNDVAHKNVDVYQMNFKCAFLNDELKETVYV